MPRMICCESTAGMAQQIHIREIDGPRRLTACHRPTARDLPFMPTRAWGSEGWDWCPDCRRVEDRYFRTLEHLRKVAEQSREAWEKSRGQSAS